MSYFLTVISISVISIISYFLGCFSTARLIAKNFKNLNIYKVGSGFADTENLFSNISKPLGILSALIDLGKMTLYLFFLRYFMNLLGYNELVTEIPLFIYGFFLITGHCLPINHNFKGGRGIFTYIGLLLVFMFHPMIYILLIACILIFVFKQIRFAQYFIVFIPPILSIFIGKPRQIIILMIITAFLMGFLNFVVSKRLGEF